MKSILQRDWGRCYLCGRTDLPFHKHHCVGGALRDKSEKYGLTVCLCIDCHLYGEHAVHKDRQTDLMLRRRAQKICMLKQGWTISQWREEFYKNYLTEGDIENGTFT